MFTSKALDDSYHQAELENTAVERLLLLSVAQGKQSWEDPMTKVLGVYMVAGLKWYIPEVYRQQGAGKFTGATFWALEW